MGSSPGLLLCDLPLAAHEEPRNSVHHSTAFPMFKFSVSHLYPSANLITLDHVAPQDMHSVIHQFKDSMEPNFKYILEFSALFDTMPSGLNLDTLTTPFNHQYSFARLVPPQIEHHYRRCPSPLIFTCASILTMLTSTAPCNSSLHSILEIVCLGNVSKQYAHHLANQSRALFSAPLDAGLHDDSNYGSLTKEERRADALMLRLEAALYPGLGHLRGLSLLGRFIIVVRRRQFIAMPDN
jgi:hypothetical protein